MGPEIAASSSQPQVPDADLPEFYRKADDASTRAQRSFLNWNRLNLVALAGVALIASIKGFLPAGGPHAAAAIVSATLLAAGAVMSFWLRKNRLEGRWYNSRAVAESVMTLSWRYMMAATPFEGASQEAEEKAAIQFEATVNDIAKQEDAPVPESREITARMKEVRSRPAKDRLDLYLNERVEDQRKWYDRKATKNQELGGRVLSVAVAAQAVACVLALILIYKETADFGGVFATVSASALAWMQLKRYEDISAAYSTAAKELRRIGSSVGAGWTPTDEELSKFVVNAENAISREHTLWVAKRT